MIGEVIAIGDELTSGQRLDTNSQWLSERLGELGVRVMYHTTVGDDLAANRQVFRVAAERAEVVVASGGLGPTADDLTRQALAAAAGVELVLDEPSLRHIEGLFARFQRPMPESNRAQAMFPAGSRPIDNPCGTAPGIALALARPAGGQCQVFALPGVPAEMKEMFAASVAPAIGALLPQPRVIRHRRIKCFGVGESQLEQMLPDLIRRGREPAVGITVHEATITLRITAAAESVQACERAIDQTAATIYSCLGELAFGEEEDELEDAVARLLAERGRSVATAEWGSAGLLAAALARVCGSGGALRGGLVQPDAALETWGQPPPDPGTRDGVAAIARRLAHQADFGLVVGRFPEQSSAGAADSYYVALAARDELSIHALRLPSHPAIWRPRAAKQALNLLRLHFVRGVRLA